MALRHWLILTAIGASFAFNEVLLAAFGPLTVSFLRVAVGAAGRWVWILVTDRRPAISCGLTVVLLPSIRAKREEGFTE
jgi:hypothetical protein